MNRLALDKRYVVLIVMSIFSIITYLDRTSISITGNNITSELGLSITQFGWVLAAFSFAYGIFEIPTGILGDKLGPKKILTRIVIWWSLFTILTGFSYTFTALLIVRFLFGVGEAGAYPNATVVISKWFPKGERGRAQSFIWIASRIGGALAPFLSVFIMNTFGWRWVFYIFGTLGIIWAIFWNYWFKDEPREMKGIKSKEIELIESKREVKSLGHGLLSIKNILKNKNVWFLMGMYHCLLYGAYFYLSWMPKYLKNGRNVGEDDIAFMASLPFILGTIGCFIGGFSSDFLSKKYGLKWGRRSVGMFGLIMAGICMITATFILDNTISIIVLSLGLAFKDFTLPVSWATAADIGGENSGSVAGAMGMAGQLGSTVMSISFGYILSMTGSWELPLQIIGVIVIIGGLLWLKIDPSQKINNTSSS
jgi:ACS family glucarate transporter-like MFS transporter